MQVTVASESPSSYFLAPLIRRPLNSDGSKKDKIEKEKENHAVK